jgi:hypothetical protein
MDDSTYHSESNHLLSASYSEGMKSRSQIHHNTKKRPFKGKSKVVSKSSAAENATSELKKELFKSLANMQKHTEHVSIYEYITSTTLLFVIA